MSKNPQKVMSKNPQKVSSRGRPLMPNKKYEGYDPNFSAADFRSRATQKKDAKINKFYSNKATKIKEKETCKPEDIKIIDNMINIFETLNMDQDAMIKQISFKYDLIINERATNTHMNEPATNTHMNGGAGGEIAMLFLPVVMMFTKDFNKATYIMNVVANKVEIELNELTNEIMKFKTALGDQCAAILYEDFLVPMYPYIITTYNSTMELTELATKFVDRLPAQIENYQTQIENYINTKSLDSMMENVKNSIDNETTKKNNIQSIIAKTIDEATLTEIKLRDLNDEVEFTNNALAKMKTISKDAATNKARINAQQAELADLKTKINQIRSEAENKTTGEKENKTTGEKENKTTGETENKTTGTKEKNTTGTKRLSQSLGEEGYNPEAKIQKLEEEEEEEEEKKVGSKVKGGKRQTKKQKKKASKTKKPKRSQKKQTKKRKQRKTQQKKANK